MPSRPRSPGQQLLFLRDHLKSPAEVHVVSKDGGGLKALTSINASKVAGVKMGDAEQFSFTGANNAKVYGWVVKPVDFDGRRRSTRWPS